MTGVTVHVAKLLESVTLSDDLRSPVPEPLPHPVREIRAFLIEKVRAIGGHSGPNLAVAEFTSALHGVFDFPRDALEFATGHRACIHKLITGRRKDFESLRQAGGVGLPFRSGVRARPRGGFPCRHRPVVCGRADQDPSAERRIGPVGDRRREPHGRPWPRGH
ncbi:hypothetical protein SGFS_084460 [Streptomyces graminofaciens]|uniref:Uncharacterized protein n=1 Tax=Streptomyces graminofaciens TaxID=68212 RepID=A0ABN5VUN6_9ACTN|nr:hypothetical protein SGFS_084460 [Streptomyces graminofaciens]